MKSFFPLFVLALTPTMVFATNVTWETTAKEYNATVEDTKTETVFKFTNTSGKPVKIVNVRASCGCTATTPPREQPYQPGEQGEVTAVFTYGDRQGRQTKVITADIATVEPDGQVGSPQSHQLTLTVNIPTVLEIEPSFIFWQNNEPHSPKTARVRVGDALPLEVLGIRVGDPNIAGRFKTITPGKEYEITLTPNDEAFKNGSNSMVLVETSLPNRRFNLFVNVVPPQDNTGVHQNNAPVVVSQPIQISPQQAQ